jgi:hypothetical protein
MCGSQTNGTHIAVQSSSLHYQVTSAVATFEGAFADFVDFFVLPS